MLEGRYPSRHSEVPGVMYPQVRGIVTQIATLNYALIGRF